MLAGGSWGSGDGSELAFLPPHPIQGQAPWDMGRGGGHQVGHQGDGWEALGWELSRARSAGQTAL